MDRVTFDRLLLSLSLDYIRIINGKNNHYLCQKMTSNQINKVKDQLKKHPITQIEDNRGIIFNSPVTNTNNIILDYNETEDIILFIEDKIRELSSSSLHTYYTFHILHLNLSDSIAELEKLNEIIWNIDFTNNFSFVLYTENSHLKTYRTKNNHILDERENLWCFYKTDMSKQKETDGTKNNF